MAKNLNVGGTIYEYPDQGTNPDWGEQAADWAEAVTEQLSSLAGQDDIPRTTFTIQNNVSEPTNVTGLAFSTGRVRTAFIEYSIYRYANDSIAGETDIYQSGKLQITFRDSTQDWIQTEEYIGDAGVILSVTSQGQVQYTATQLPDDLGQYQSRMVFRGSSFIQ